MIGKLLDKLVFGVTLIFALQIPQLADHYQQFLSGMYQATKSQVEGYESTASRYEYPSVRAMVEHHLKNDVKSVRADAQQKLATLELFEELEAGIQILKSGNIIDKATYMLNPVRYDYLEKTVHNFKPGIPLTTNGIVFGIVFGLVVNLLITFPFVIWSKRKRHHTRSAKDIRSA
ncbi:DUF2937 family protein [Aliamphritea ceti]|uniref:DUF2937 family protein n=1 Tax=Aliamphritea ceti TaxID=1524258 RepID=UPI0021C455D9|nr:DUF2937 family protein [Aliamphritea ceti]